MSCITCGSELVKGQRKFCSVECKNVEKGLRQRQRQDDKVDWLLREEKCWCGYDNVGALMFVHKEKSQTEIDDILRGRLGASDIAILRSCEIVCRNCVWLSRRGRGE